MTKPAEHQTHGPSIEAKTSAGNREKPLGLKPRANWQRAYRQVGVVKGFGRDRNVPCLKGVKRKSGK